MSVAMKNDPLTLVLENRQLLDHNQALASALREVRTQSETFQKDLNVLSQDVQDLEEERRELERSLNQRNARLAELESELSQIRRRNAPRPAPPPPPPLKGADRLIASALKRMLLGRPEESLELFARLGGASPVLASFYQKLFHDWVMVGTSMDGGQFARRTVFGLKGKLRERFVRAYCAALEALCKRPNTPTSRRRQWLLELAELHLEHPRQAMTYLIKARKAS